MKETKKRGKLRSIPGGKGGGDATPPDGETRANLLDFGSAHDQRTQENRRRVQRHFLDEVLEVFCEIAGRERALPVRLDEVGESGCSFTLGSEEVRDLPAGPDGLPRPFEAKIYFSRDSFIRVGFTVTSLAPELSSHGERTRVGCRLDPAFSASQAFVQFVRFVEAFCVHCGRDLKRTGSG